MPLLQYWCVSVSVYRHASLMAELRKGKESWTCVLDGIRIRDVGSHSFLLYGLFVFRRCLVASLRLCSQAGIIVPW